MKTSSKFKDNGMICMKTTVINICFRIIMFCSITSIQIWPFKLSNNRLVLAFAFQVLFSVSSQRWLPIATEYVSLFSSDSKSNVKMLIESMMFYISHNKIIISLPSTFSLTLTCMNELNNKSFALFVNSSLAVH